MTYGTWDTFFNLLILIFWVRAWHRDGRTAFFNPYINSILQGADSVIHFLRPVFGRLPDRGVAVILMIFLGTLRALAVPAQTRWIVPCGFISAEPRGTAIVFTLLFSLISFAQLLFTCWAVSLLYARHSLQQHREHTEEALLEVCRPFSLVKPTLRPAVLLGYGIVLGVGMIYGARLVRGVEIATAPPLLLGIKLILSALMNWVQSLGIIQTALIMLIILSWVSAFSGSMPLTHFCRTWTDFLLGPMRHRPVRLAMIDLTPLVFIFIIGAIQLALAALVASAFYALP